MFEPLLGPLGSLLNQLRGLSQLGPVGSVPLSWGGWGPSICTSCFPHLRLAQLQLDCFTRRCYLMKGTAVKKVGEALN